MMPPALQAPAIFEGHVVHKRLRPVAHHLRYSVFNFLIDVDEIGRAAGRYRFLSYNHWNVFSIYDADHGSGDGASIADGARSALKSCGKPYDGRRILMLCYPRVLGYVFNPLTVFFALNPDGELESLIYEVNNTFGERKSYVVNAGAPSPDGVFSHGCRKEMFVSPFTQSAGRYSFRVIKPGDKAVVGVFLADASGPLLKTHFRGKGLELTDRRLLSLIWRYPLLTLKVIAAIHYEALKLWLKGVPLTERHQSPRYSVTSGHVAHRGQT